MELYENVNYLLDIDYIKNATIIEYDLSKANINALLFTKRIPKSEYDYLNSLDKHSREVYVGLKIKNDKSIYKSIQQGIIYAKRQFFEQNAISNNDVLAIKNDAVFVINREPKYTHFGDFRFSLKNIYNSFYKIPTPRNKLECYYRYDNISKEDILDVKGIGEKALEYHKGYFLDFLTVVFYILQRFDDIPQAIDVVKNTYSNYTNYEFVHQFYREFSSISKYKFGMNLVSGEYYADHISEEDKRSLDISYNMNIIIYLYKLLSNMYFSNR
jgi:hypothetical protein